MKTLWQTLHDEKLVTGEEPNIDTDTSPWYIKTLLAFTGWLAAIFVLAFLATAFNGLIENEIALIIFGIIMIFISYNILKKESSDFVEHLGLAISVAGQILIFIALTMITRDQVILFWTLILVLQVVLILVIPNYIHRFFSAFMATYSFSFLLSFLGMPHTFTPLMLLILAYLWLNEYHFKEIYKMQAIGYGVVIALLYLHSTALRHQIPFFWPHSGHIIPLWFAPWLGTVLSAMVAIYVLRHILEQYNKELFSKLGMITMLTVVLLSLLAVKIPLLMVGLFILILGFYHSNRVLIGLGIVSLLFAISSYYYYLKVTLLEKASMLLLVGVVILLIRWVVFHILLTRKEQNYV